MKVFYIAVLAVVISGASCLKDKQLLFCEGTSPDGKGVNCGTKFTTGDFNAVLNAGKSFGVSMLQFTLYDADSNDKVASYNVKVKPEETNAQATITTENAGKYKITVTANREIIAEGVIEIIDM